MNNGYVSNQNDRQIILVEKQSKRERLALLRQNHRGPLDEEKNGSVVSRHVPLTRLKVFGGIMPYFGMLSN